MKMRMSGRRRRSWCGWTFTPEVDATRHKEVTQDGLSPSVIMSHPRLPSLPFLAFYLAAASVLLDHRRLGCPLPVDYYTGLHQDQAKSRSRKGDLKREVSMRPKSWHQL